MRDTARRAHVVLSVCSQAFLARTVMQSKQASVYPETDWTIPIHSATIYASIPG